MDDQRASQMGRWALQTVAGALLIWMLANLRPLVAVILSAAVVATSVGYVVSSERRKPAGSPMKVLGVMLVLTVVGGLAGWLAAEFRHVLFTS